MGEFLFIFIALIVGYFALSILWGILGAFKPLFKDIFKEYKGCLPLIIIFAVIALVLSYIF